MAPLCPCRVNSLEEGEDKDCSNHAEYRKRYSNIANHPQCKRVLSINLVDRRGRCEYVVQRVKERDQGEKKRRKIDRR